MAEQDQTQGRTSYARIQEKYGGKYIATRDDEVIASAETHGELVKALEEAGDYADDVVLEYVRPKGQICAY